MPSRAAGEALSGREPPAVDGLGGAGEAVQQRDNLCGPFHVARVLRDLGMTEWDGVPLDQDLVALHAGTVLPEHEDGPQVPPGAANLRDYRYKLKVGEQADSGTRAPELAGALEKLSGGRLSCVPISGSWSAESVVRLVDGAGALGARLIANIRTGRLWASRPALDVLLGWLERGDAPDPPPPPDWDVGHFVELVQLVRGRAGTLVVLRDSYPTLGWSGHHLQPPDAVAAALVRGDGRRGGVLCVVGPEHVGAARRLAGTLGLDTELWHN